MGFNRREVGHDRQLCSSFSFDFNNYVSSYPNAYNHRPEPSSLRTASQPTLNRFRCSPCCAKAANLFSAVIDHEKWKNTKNGTSFFFFSD